MIFEKLHISINSNSKLSSIPSISLPPVITCRTGAPCARDCYACRGNYRFESVKKGLTSNLEQYRQSPAEYFKAIIDFLRCGVVTYRFFRWHAAGDIVDMDYLRGMVKVARACRGVRFLCFTKKFELVNTYLTEGGTIPQNLKIVFSAWDKSFKVTNIYGLPVAFVDFCDFRTPTIPVQAIPCGGSCADCLQCFRLKDGESVVFKKH